MPPNKENLHSTHEDIGSDRVESKPSLETSNAPNPLEQPTAKESNLKKKQLLILGGFMLFVLLPFFFMNKISNNSRNVSDYIKDITPAVSPDLQANKDIAPKYPYIIHDCRFVYGTCIKQLTNSDTRPHLQDSFIIERESIEQFLNTHADNFDYLLSEGNSLEEVAEYVDFMAGAKFSINPQLILAVLYTNNLPFEEIAERRRTKEEERVMIEGAGELGYVEPEAEWERFVGHIITDLFDGYYGFRYPGNYENGHQIVFGDGVVSEIPSNSTAGNASLYRFYAKYLTVGEFNNLFDPTSEDGWYLTYFKLFGHYPDE